MLRGLLDLDLSIGFGSGVTSTARPGKSGTAGVRISRRRRTTQPERQRERREHGKQYPLHAESFPLGGLRSLGKEAARLVTYILGARR